MKTILITGGARSGKSRFAQELALKTGQPVLFVATAEPGDEDMRCRIEEHKKHRPSTWQTLEAATHIGNCIRKNIGKNKVVLIDCITLLVNNIFTQYTVPDEDRVDPVALEKYVTQEIKELLDCISHVKASFIIVTNEVGLGLVPDNRISRVYRDLLGKANQMLAARADEVYLMVSGLALPLKK